MALRAASSSTLTIWDKLRRGYEINRFNNARTAGVMSSPPTVTLLSARPAPNIHSFPFATSSASYYVTGGGPPNNSGSGTTWVFPACSVGSGGNTGPSAKYNMNGFRLKVVVDALDPVFQVLSSASTFRFLVVTNGVPQYVSLTGTTPSNGGTGNYIQLVFSSRAQREIWVESTGGSTPIVGIWVRGSETVQPAPTGLRMTFLGDSLTAGTIGGGGNQSDGWVYVFGEAFGIADIRASGVGGQGYITQAGGSNWNLQQRLTPGTNADAFNVDAPASDVFVLAMGTNDASTSTYAQINTATQFCINALLTQYPTTPILVTGCPACGTGPNEVSAMCDLAISAAVTAINSPLVIFIADASAQPTPFQQGVGTSAAPCSGTVAITGTLNAATSCTLSANFAGPTGNYTIAFNTAAGPVTKNVNITSAGTSVSWSGSITSTDAFMTYWGQNAALTLTASPAAGATSATLSAGFSLTTDTYLAVFSSGEVRSCSMTNAGTGVNWTDALLLPASTSIAFFNSTTYPGNSDQYYASGQHTHPITSGHQMLGFARADASYALIKSK